jgi:glutamate formiminotransferase
LSLEIGWLFHDRELIFWVLQLMIECIPNFSEGRRPEVIAAIVRTIADVANVAVLDVHTDADHNRSVVTFAGEEHAVAEAAFRAVHCAAELIDLRQHTGQHPRIGATDVLPFVPLAGSRLADCVQLAHTVGQRIGTELGIPVYLYEAAATRPERRELPALRHGGYEGLAEAIGHDPARIPDYGPALLGSAGATVVGARNPLIAFNIFLNSADVQIAKAIAKAIRGSSGGLRGVRALGMLVAGRAQVSMNLTDYQTTPVHRVFEMVAREAQAYGTSVAESELVGLIPEDALIDAARYWLRLPNMGSEQILERQIRRQIKNS